MLLCSDLDLEQEPCGEKDWYPESIDHKAVPPGSFSYLDLLPFQEKFHETINFGYE